MRKASDELARLQDDTRDFATRCLRIVVAVLFVVMLLDVALGLEPWLSALRLAIAQWRLAGL